MYQEMINQLQDSVREANSHLLESSRQGGFLCIGTIAAAPFWAILQDSDPRYLVIISFLSLILSCLFSAFIHFIVGFRMMNSVRQIVKKLRAGERVEDQSYVMQSAFVIAGLQALTAFVGLIGAGACLFYAVY